MSDPGELASAETAMLAADLRMALMRTARRLRQERADDDVSPAALSVLFTVDNEGPITLGDLAELENVRPPSMTRTVAVLEDAGLITRSTHPDDRRQVLVSCTELGRAMTSETRRRRTAWLARRLESMSEQDRATLAAAAAILHRLAEK